MRTLTVCLGPSEVSRCPTGALVPGGRCGPCGAVWRLRHPVRQPDPAERREHEAILAAWLEVNGRWCPGHEATGHPPHRVTRRQDLTVHHLQDVATGGMRAGGPKQVLCRSWNSHLGAQLGNALRAEEAGDA